MPSAIMGTSGRTTSVRARSTMATSASITRTVSSVVPAASGRPLSTPRGVSVSPRGSVPLVTDQVSGGRPPVAPSSTS